MKMNEELREKLVTSHNKEDYPNVVALIVNHLDEELDFIPTIHSWDSIVIEFLCDGSFGVNNHLLTQLYKMNNLQASQVMDCLTNLKQFCTLDSISLKDGTRKALELGISIPERAKELYDKYRDLIGARTYNQGVESLSQSDLEAECYLLLNGILEENSDVYSMPENELTYYLSFRLRQHVQFLRTYQSRKCRSLEENRAPDFYYDSLADNSASITDATPILPTFTPTDQNMEFLETMEEIYTLLSLEEGILLDHILNPSDDIFETINSINWERKPSVFPHWMWKNLMVKHLGRSVQDYEFKEWVENIRNIVGSCCDRLDILEKFKNITSPKFGVATR